MYMEIAICFLFIYLHVYYFRLKQSIGKFGRVHKAVNGMNRTCSSTNLMIGSVFFVTIVARGSVVVRRLDDNQNMHFQCHFQ